MYFLFLLFRVELALWTHFVATQLQPDLLDGIPAATISSSTTVVETTTPSEGDDEIKTKTTTVTNVDDVESTADENSTDLPSAGESNGNGKNGRNFVLILFFLIDFIVLLYVHFSSKVMEFFSFWLWNLFDEHRTLSFINFLFFLFH